MAFQFIRSDWRKEDTMFTPMPKSREFIEAELLYNRTFFNKTKSTDKKEEIIAGLKEKSGLL